MMARMQLPFGVVAVAHVEAQQAVDLVLVQHAFRQGRAHVGFAAEGVQFVFGGQGVGHV